MNSVNTKLCKAVRMAIVLGTMSYAVPATYAQEAEDAENDNAEDMVVRVTGSRIRRDEFASPSPIQILSVDEAKQAGVTNVADMIQRISLVNGLQINGTINTNAGLSNASEAPPPGGVGSVNVGLRGLGGERTLILINGRRLGASGVRGAPSQPDLSLIPMDMVDRVEVLSDSASAIYGADAVAGVINVILKDSMDGAQVSVNFSTPSDPGGEVKQISFATGGESERFKFVLGGEYYDRERITLGDRVDCISDRLINASSGETYEFCWNRFPDNVVLSQIPGNVWTFATPGSSDLINPMTGQPVTGFSSANGIPDVWSSQYSFLRGDVTGNDRFRLNRNYNDDPDRMRSDLVQPTTRFSLVSNGSYMPEWGEENNIEFTYDTSYFHRHLKNIATTEQIYMAIPAVLPLQTGTDNLGNPIFDRDVDGNIITTTHPYNPFGTETLPVVTLDGFNQTREVELDHFRFATGINGDLPGEWFKEKGWTFDISGSYDRGDGVATQPQLDSRNFALALETAYVDLNGEVQCGLTTNTSDPFAGIVKDKPCYPVNFLRDAIYGNNGNSTGRMTDAERKFLLGERVNRTVVTQTVFSGFVSGELFDFDDGGSASLVFGVESRRDTIDSQADFNGSKGYFIAESPTTEGLTRGTRTVQEAFTEISLPFIQGKEGIDELSVDLALRYTDESNFGSENTERVRVLYSPTDWIDFSVAYGTSFRAPNLREQFLGDQTSGVSGGADPCNGGAFIDNTGTYDPTLETRSQTTLDNCVQDGVDPTQLGGFGTTTIPVLTAGNVSGLLPETAEQTTFTLKATPIETDNLNFDFAITYFDIEIKNTISQVGAETILAECYNTNPGLTSPYCAYVGPRDMSAAPANQFITVVDDSFYNLGQENSKGYDINTRLSYIFDDVMGDSLEMVWTNQITIQDELSEIPLVEIENPEKIEKVGTHGVPEMRFVTRLNFTLGDWSLLYTGRYVDETERLITAANFSNANSRCSADRSFASTVIVGAPQVYRDCLAESKFYHDLALTWTPEDNFTATFGISNLTDESPATVGWGLPNQRGNRVVGAGYDQVGQSLFLSSTYKF